jgi:HEAT repeat protein
MDSPSEFLRHINNNDREVLYRCRRAAPSTDLVVSRLSELLSHGISQVAAEALRALHCIGPAAVEAAPTVTILLKHDDAIVKSLAVSTLGQICLESPATALVHLQGAAEDPQLLKPVLFALINFGQAAAPTETLFVRAYESRDAVIRRLAVRGLRMLRTNERSALAVLRKALKDTNGEVRRVAQRANEEMRFA